MVNTCGVYACKNRRSRGSDRGYYRLPAVIFRQGETTKCLTAERRKLWLARILPQTSVANLRVCSDHFIKGKPSDLYDKTNPDWAPSIKLGYNNVKSPKDHSEKNICKEETDDEQLLWKQERSSSLDEEKPELPLIKEEWEEVFITEEVEQLELKQEIDAFMVTEDDQENMDSKPVLEENSRIRKSDSVTVQLDSPSHETSNSCKICGKVYIRSAYLETHMKTHMKTNSAVKSVFREIYPKPSGIFLVWATT